MYHFIEVEPTRDPIPPTVCDPTGLYSDPRDCAGYYICRNGVLVKMRCVAHMMFDPTYGECGYIDPSRCRPGQFIHIPNALLKDSNFNTLTNEPLRDNKPKVDIGFHLFNRCFKLVILFEGRLLYYKLVLLPKSRRKIRT